MFKKNYRFPLILLVSIILGSILGIILGDSATYLKPLGNIFINLLYVIVVPLVFFTISSSISSIKNYRKLGKIFRTMFVVFVITSMIASLFMLFGVKIFNPVKDVLITLSSYSKTNIDIGSKLVDMVSVSDFNLVFSKNNMLPLIIFSIIFGIGCSMLKEGKEKVNYFLNICSNICMNVIKIIMLYAPIGLFAYFASLVGEYGAEILGSYAKSMIFYIVMAILYYLIFYTVYAYIARGKRGIKDFYSNIFTPTITSLGTCSSLASLPTNFKCAKDMNIDSDVARTTLPIGATMHMEGSSMAAILKIAFLFSVFGRSFTGVDTYLIAILIAVLSGVVMSGIPGGGLIGEMLIVSLYGFPLEAFPIIATIGWIVDPPATTLNVVGDITSSMLIEKHIT